MKFEFNKKTIIVFLLVFAIATFGITFARVKIGNFLDNRIFSGDETEDEPIVLSTLISGDESPYAKAFEDGQRVNVLVLGIATTTIGNQLTDTIMLVSYDMEEGSLDLISVPRDTYHNRPQYSIWSGNQKINSIYETEGISGIAKAVSYELSNIPIHYYVTVEYDDIRTLIDVINGVDIEIPFDLKYDDPLDDPPLHIDIPAGLQHIDSSNVIELLRFRKTNSWLAEQGYKGYSDIGRMEMQQTFIKACIKKTLSETSYIKKMLKTAMACLGSDLTYNDALKILKNVANLDMNNINTYTVPTTSKDVSETGDVSFLWVDNAALTEMLDEIFLDDAE